MNKYFTPKRILVAVFTAAMVSITSVSLTNSGGAQGGRSNAPGESNCTGCHGGTLQTSGTNFNNVSLTNNFTGGGYIPDSTYTITLSYTQSGKSKFGMQLTCLDGSNLMAGSFANTTTATSITSSVISGNTRSYVRQTGSGNSGTGGRSWSFEWTAPSTNKGDLTLYTIVNSANNNGGTSGDIIIAREFTLSPSSLLPVASASAANNTVCQGEFISLTGSGTNTPTSYSWSFTNATPSVSTAQNPSTKFNFSGNNRAILTVTNAKGASAPDTLALTVISAPGPFIAGGATRTICQEDSVLLSVPQETGVTYTWNTGTTGRELWVSRPGIYFINGLATNGCDRNSNEITVDTFPKPIATLSSNVANSNDSTCENSTVILEASSAAFDSFYYYADGLLIAASDSQAQSVLFDSTTTYGLVVLNSNGCKSDLYPYVVRGRERDAAPAVSCIAATPSSIEFSWTSTTAHSGYQISLNEGITWVTPSSGSIGTSHLVSGLQPEDSVLLWVRSIAPGPCDYSLIGKVKCFSTSCVQLEATVQAAASVCKGELWTIEVNGLSDENYSLSLDGGATFTDTIISFNPTLSKTYQLSITDSNNRVCPAKRIAIPVVVDNIADIDLKPEKIGAYCEGDELTFSANDSIENFEFYLNTALVQSSASNTFSSTMNAGDSVYVVVTKGSCTDTSEQVYANIEIAADATFTYSRDGTEYTFTPNTTGYQKYAWDFGDGNVEPNDPMPVHDYAASEGDAVTAILDVTTISECRAKESEAIQLPMFSNVEILTQLGINVYPNPAQDMVYIENKENKSMDISIHSLTGETVLVTTITNDYIDISSLNTGVYLLRIRIGEQEASLRVLKK
jgi:PKD repeat protein